MQIRIRDCTFFATSFVPLVDMHASPMIPTACFMLLELL